MTPVAPPVPMPMTLLSFFYDLSSSFYIPESEAFVKVTFLQIHCSLILLAQGQCRREGRRGGSLRSCCFSLPSRPRLPPLSPLPRPDMTQCCSVCLSVARRLWRRCGAEQSGLQCSRCCTTYCSWWSGRLIQTPALRPHPHPLPPGPSSLDLLSQQISFVTPVGSSLSSPIFAKK